MSEETKQKPENNLVHQSYHGDFNVSIWNKTDRKTGEKKKGYTVSISKSYPDFKKGEYGKYKYYLFENDVSDLLACLMDVSDKLIQLNQRSN